jgi:MFS family permease
MASSSRSLLRHPDFLKLWTGETVSVFGTAITQLALPIIAATTLHVSAFEFGLLTTIDFLPFILFSLPAGVWVDRLRRRPILIVGDIGRALAIASIPVAFAVNNLTIWQLYAVGFVNGCLTVFFDVAYQSYLPSIVDRDQLVEGNSKLEITSRRSGRSSRSPIRRTTTRARPTSPAIPRRPDRARADLGQPSRIGTRTPRSFATSIARW